MTYRSVCLRLFLIAVYVVVEPQLPTVECIKLHTQPRLLRAYTFPHSKNVAIGIQELGPSNNAENPGGKLQLIREQAATLRARVAKQKNHVRQLMKLFASVFKTVKDTEGEETWKHRDRGTRSMYVRLVDTQQQGIQFKWPERNRLNIVVQRQPFEGNAVTLILKKKDLEPSTVDSVQLRVYATDIQKIPLVRALQSNLNLFLA